MSKGTRPGQHGEIFLTLLIILPFLLPAGQAEQPCLGNTGDIHDFPRVNFRVYFEVQAPCEFASFVATTLQEAYNQFNLAYKTAQGDPPLQYSPQKRMKVYLTEKEGLTGEYSFLSESISASVGYGLAHRQELRDILSHELFHAVQDAYANMYVGGNLAHWWYEATAEWAGRQTVNTPYPALVRAELGAYPYFLGVPIQESKSVNDLLPYAFALLIDHVQRQSPGYLLRTLHSSAFTSGQLYDQLVKEGKLSQTYGDFVRTVLVTAQTGPQPTTPWLTGEIRESNDKTIVATPENSAVNASMRHRAYTSVQERERMQHFSATLGPLTARVFRIHAAGLRNSRDITASLNSGAQPSRQGMLIKTNNNQVIGTPQDFPADGIAICKGIGRDFSDLWLAVYNPDPYAAMPFDLGISLHDGEAIPESGPAAEMAQHRLSGLGHLQVKVLDAATGDNLNDKARLTLNGPKGKSPFAGAIAAGKENDLPVGIYDVQAEDTRSGARDELKNIEVIAGETTEITLHLKLMPGYLAVIVAERQNQIALKGVNVSVNGAVRRGPQSSPCTFELPAGSYNVEVPAFTRDNIAYKERSFGPVQVVSAKRTLATVELESQVLPPQSATLRISPGYLELEKGDDYGLLAEVYDGQGQIIPDAPVTWSSSAPNVASVDATGKVTAVNRGKASITALSGSVQSSIPVTVTSAAMLATVRITNPPGPMQRHETYVLYAVALDTDGQVFPQVTWRWSSSNYEVATVNSSDGSLHTQKSGRCTIYAVASDSSDHQAQAELELIVEQKYPEVLVSGIVVHADGSPAAGAGVECSTSEQIGADGTFTVLATAGPYVDGSIIKVTATLKGKKGSASGPVVDGQVKGLRIVIPNGNGGGTPAITASERQALESRLAEWQKSLDCLLAGKFKYPNMWLDCNGNFTMGSRDVEIERLQRLIRETRLKLGLPVSEPPVTASQPESGRPGTRLPESSQPPVIGGAMTLADFSGPELWLTPPGGMEKPLAAVNEITPGSSLRTGKGSRIVLRSPAHTTVTVADSSRVKLPVLEAGAKNRILELLGGGIEVNHPETEPSFDDLNVRTRDGSISPLGSRYRVQLQERGTLVQVLGGKVRLQGPYIIRTHNGQAEGKPSPVKQLDLNAGQEALLVNTAFNQATEGREATGAAPPPLDRPDPWNDAQVQQLMDEWLHVAVPPSNTPGVVMHYNEWAQPLSQAAQATAHPDHPADWSRYRYLWENRSRYTSVSHCTLGQYVERRLKGKSLDDCRQAGTNVRAAIHPPLPGLLAPLSSLPETDWLNGQPQLAGHFTILYIYTAPISSQTVPNIVLLCLRKAQNRLPEMAQAQVQFIALVLGKTSDGSDARMAWQNILSVFRLTFPLALDRNGSALQGFKQRIPEGKKSGPPPFQVFLLDPQGKIVFQGECEQLDQKLPNS